MSSTSPNFSLILATNTDNVNVVAHISGPLSTIDSILAVAHTGTGQLKSSLTLVTPTLTNPTLSGTMTGGVVVASTGSFNTLLATGGTVTFNTLNIGTYALPSTVGQAGQVIVAQTGNAVWSSNAPSTGANETLSNLTTVALNTSLNTFTAGFVTAARVISTSGALTGLTVFQASTGTFAGNLAVTGTVNASAINVTGGAITAASLTIGTYSLPATIGATGQILTVTTNNAVWLTPTVAQTTVYFRAYATTAGIATTAAVIIAMATEAFDSASVFDTASYQFVVTASGYYLLGGAVGVTGEALAAGIVQISGSGGPYVLGYAFKDLAAATVAVNGSVLIVATSGAAYSMQLVWSTGTSVGYVPGQSLTYFWGMKIPDA